jgi:F420H(2)-dependent quinone reductase
MMYLADDDSRDGVHVFASAAGADRDPDWFHNVVAHPNGLTVEMGDATVTAGAEVLGEPLRTEVYAVQAGRYPMARGASGRSVLLIVSPLVC